MIVIIYLLEDAIDGYLHVAVFEDRAAALDFMVDMPLSYTWVRHNTGVQSLSVAVRAALRALVRMRIDDYHFEMYADFVPYFAITGDIQRLALFQHPRPSHVRYHIRIGMLDVSWSHA